MRTIIARAAWATCITGVAIAAFYVYVMYPPAQRPITFPEGKRFAFTIVDDTDLTTVERVRPLYDLLHRYGLRTTKTVWVWSSDTASHPTNGGHSLQDPEYREFVEDLQQRGFEIALHGVRGGSSERAEILLGLDEYRRIVGTYPQLHVNHALNADNVYWGKHRWSFPPYQWLYGALFGDSFSGHEPSSPHYWADALKERVTYVNQFTFSDINLLNVTPWFPYHLPDKPAVNLWFPTSDGGNLEDFEELLSTENLDRLEREGGVSLVYSHLGAGSFNKEDGARFEARLRELATRNGWFAPASEILNHLRAQPGWTAEPTWRERVRLETIFLWQLFFG